VANQRAKPRKSVNYAPDCISPSTNARMAFADLMSRQLSSAIIGLDNGRYIMAQFVDNIDDDALRSTPM